MNVIEVGLSSPNTLEGDIGAAKLIQGPPGEAATVEIGTVTNGDIASVTNAGDDTHAVLNFVLPKGDEGKSAFDMAQEAGYTGTEDEFTDALLNLGDIAAVLDEINGEAV